MGFVASTLVLASCRARAPLAPETPVEGLSTERIKKCILTGAVRKGWKTRVVSSGYIVATYTKGENVACVDIHYDARGYRITMNDATTMVMPDGMVHAKYNTWVKNLDAAINQQCNLETIK